MALDTTHSSRRWMAVGTSLSTDPYEAGQAATRDALESPDPQLLLVFAGIGHDPHRLSEGIQSAAPGVPVIGCSTHGEINPHGPGDGSVVVTAPGGAGFSVATAATAPITGRQRTAGAEVACCATNVSDRPHRAVLLLTDGLARDQEAVLRGAYGVLGATGSTVWRRCRRRSGGGAVILRPWHEASGIWF